VVKRNSAVVTGNLCEANIPPTTINPLPIAIRVIITCKIVKAPTDIPRIMESSRCWSTRSQAEECATLTPITAAIKLHGNNVELPMSALGQRLNTHREQMLSF
jgi:hypothetical protein